MSKRTIYVPRGRAFEYSPLACDLYKGCAHGCKYCYGNKGANNAFENDVANLKPIPNILEKIEADAKKLEGDKREILFSFSSDPFFSAEATSVTMEALKICEKYNLNAQVLTKAGCKASVCFDMLERNNWRFGSTIIFGNDNLREEWEPNAAPILDRVAAVMEAHTRGIYTWVSIEPVIDPDSALKLMEMLKGYVSLWKVGKLNHMPEIEATIDWKDFIRKSMVTLKGERVNWKKDLIACI